MNKLIKADMRRIHRKKGFGVLMFFMLFFQFWDALIITDETADKIMSTAQKHLGISHLLLIVVFIFLSVIADDRKCNIREANIAMGLGREKFMIVKFFEFTLLLINYYIIMVPVRLLSYKMFSVPLSNRQLGLIVLYSVFTVIHGIICLMTAMLAELAADSVVAGMITLVSITTLLTIVLKTVEAIYKMNLYNFVPGGLLENAYVNMTVGKLPWQLIPAFFYGVVVFAASCALFAKKELQL